jgi:hypothetical protein
LETIASLPGFGMAPEGHLSYSSGPNIRPGRTQPCSVRVRIDPIPPKALRQLLTCHRQRSSWTVAPTSGKPVRVARHQAYRDKQFQRRLHDLGNLDVWCPRDLVVTYSQHYCTKCRKYFNADLSDLAPPGGQYTHRVIDLAGRLVVEDGLPYRPASWHLWRDHRVFVPFATIQNWVEAGGKKGAGAHGHRLPRLGVG